MFLTQQELTDTQPLGWVLESFSVASCLSLLPPSVAGFCFLLNLPEAVFQYVSGECSEPDQGGGDQDWTWAHPHPQRGYRNCPGSNTWEGVCVCTRDQYVPLGSLLIHLLIFFLEVLEFELRTSHLLGRPFTT
jgi:hypothetical protein